MLKPFYNRKVNIDDRLVPEVTAEDAGKALIVGEDGKITTGEGDTKLYRHTIKLNTAAINVREHTIGMILDFISDRSSKYTLDDLKTELVAGNYTQDNPFLISPMTRITSPWSNYDTTLLATTIFGIYANINESRIYISSTYSTLYEFTIENGDVKINRTTPSSIYYTTTLEDTSSSYKITPISL